MNSQRCSWALDKPIELNGLPSLVEAVCRQRLRLFAGVPDELRGADVLQEIQVCFQLDRLGDKLDLLELRNYLKTLFVD